MWSSWNISITWKEYNNFNEINLFIRKKIESKIFLVATFAGMLFMLDFTKLNLWFLLSKEYWTFRL